MAIINISGTISASFQTTGVLVNAAQGAGEVIFTIDLRPTTPEIIVQDNVTYAGLGWNINDVVATIILIGPEGEIYRNEDFENPDIVPATSRYLNKTITLPLDPLTNYQNILQGNYTLKVMYYNSNLDEYYNFLDVYQYDFDPPTITNTTVSGPYTGILKSNDTTEYGNDVYQIIREHRIIYPDELDPQPADIVSSNAEVQVSPIYTNEWTIQISSFVEYRKSDDLRIYWEGSGEFTHCVYGGCIGAMYEAIENMLATFTDELACNLITKEQYEQRLVIVNTAWHLLNEAYWSGEAEEADEQAYIIQEQVAYTGSGICGGSSSEEVIPCPPYTGGGVGGTYTFANGLTEGGGNVVWGGYLTQATTINTGVHALTFSGASGSNSYAVVLGEDIEYLDFRKRSGDYGSAVHVGEFFVDLLYTDYATPANSKTYRLGSSGLVEDSDYSAGYTALSLVNKSYVDGILTGLDTVATDATISGDGTVGDPLSVATPFPGFTDLLTDYGYTEPTHEFSEITNTPTTLAGYGITDAPTTFLQMTDTPASYSGFGGYFVRVNTGATGLEFVTGGTWVPATGGTFTGQVIISTSNDRPIVLKQIGVGSNPGVPEAGTNLVSFQDNDGDEQGYVGIDASGNIILHSSITGGGVLADDDLTVNGDVAVTGTMTIDTINEYTANNGVVVDGVTIKDGKIAHTYLPYTIQNGLHLDGDNIELGGTLGEATDITGSGSTNRLRLRHFVSATNSEYIAFEYDNVIDVIVFANDDYTGDQAKVYLNEGEVGVKAFSGANESGVVISTSAMTVTDTINTKGLVYAADYSTNWTDHSLITKKWVTDNFIQIAGNVIVGYATKQTGSDAGTQGELSIDDDYLYVCTVTGGIGVAIWKRVPLMQT